VSKLPLRAVVVAIALLVAVPQSASARSCTPGWKVFETIPRAQLSSVSLVPGTREAWAVGRYFDPGVAGDRTLIMRFDGYRWSQVPSPEPQPTVHAELRAVFARSGSNVWAVGHEGRRTLVMHWNGSEWSIVKSQNPVFTDESDNARLNDVVAFGRNDAKAVGQVFREARTPQMVTLAERLNGSTWRILPSSSPGDYRSKLKSVARVPGSRTLWSVGNHMSDADYPAVHPLIERYRHGVWRQIAAPALPGQELDGVTAVAWNDVWAVGNSGFADGSALTLHFDGRRWRLVPSAPSPGMYGKLSAVSAVSANDIWAVGNLDERPDADGGGGFRRPLMQHWDGSSWSIVASPVDGPYDVLTDVAMRRTGFGWSVGWGIGGSYILRHCPA
jgi:hypothetical protein